MVERSLVGSRNFKLSHYQTEDHYRYYQSSYFGKQRVDLYFRSENDYSMLIQYVTQWKLNLVEDDDIGEDDWVEEEENSLRLL